MKGAKIESLPLVIEQENGKAVAQSFEDNGYGFLVGNLLPTTLPNSVPDISGPEFTFIDIVGHTYGKRSGYQIRLKFRSSLQPEDILKKFSGGGKLQRGEGRAQWSRSIGDESIENSQLNWSTSGSETTYYYNTGYRGLDRNSNRPFPDKK